MPPLACVTVVKCRKFRVLMLSSSLLHMGKDAKHRWPEGGKGWSWQEQPDAACGSGCTGPSCRQPRRQRRRGHAPCEGLGRGRTRPRPVQAREPGGALPRLPALLAALHTEHNPGQVHELWMCSATAILGCWRRWVRAAGGAAALRPGTPGAP